MERSDECCTGRAYLRRKMRIFIPTLLSLFLLLSSSASADHVQRIGEGAKNKGVMHYTLHYKHLHGYNKYRPGECSTWMSELGFSNEDILDTVLNVLEERCMSINNEH
jgi:hypothetical protein